MRSRSDITEVTPNQKVDKLLRRWHVFFLVLHFCWLFFNKQTNDSCMLLLKHPTFFTYHCISLKFSHFSDKAEYPWLFPGCLFETLLKTLCARTALPVSRRCSANPSLSSDRRHKRPSALGGDGAAPAPCDTLPMSHANPAPVICIWPDGTRTFSHQVVSLAAERGCVFFLAHHAPSSETRTTGSDVAASFWVHFRWAHFFVHVTRVMNKPIIVHAYTYIWMCCAFRDVILQILIVVAWVPVVFPRSDHWPLTWAGNVFFLPHNCSSMVIFYFWGRWPVVMRWKSQ